MLLKEFEECFENNKYKEKMLEHFIKSEIGEIHHIVPRSYFKLKNKKVIDNDNIIKVSYEDHLWIHYYAWKCAKPIIKKSMAFAIYFILNNCNNKQLKEKIKDYSLIREEIAKKAKFQKGNKKVICLETNEIYPSLGEAERKTKIDKRLISNTCNLKRKVAGGFHWCFAENYYDEILEDIINLSNKNSFKKKKIICLETNKIYESEREAEKETGISFSNISSCIRKKSKTAGGYHWYEYYENITCSKELKNEYNYKCVENGKFYKSINQAAKELNISQGYLNRQTKNGKSAKGFTIIKINN